MSKNKGDTDTLKIIIEDAFERRAALTPEEIEASVKPAVEQAISGLEDGALRVAEPDGSGGWRWWSSAPSPW